jgi:Putative beta-barrel porin 2
LNGMFRIASVPFVDHRPPMKSPLRIASAPRSLLPDSDRGTHSFGFPFSLFRLRSASAAAVLAFCLVAAAATASAQDIVASVPAEELVPIAVQQDRAAQGFVPMSIGPISAADTSLFAWGPATLRAHLAYSYLYGDGIPSAPGQNYTTSIHNITPDFLVDLGTHWSVDYSPSWKFYSNKAFSNTVDQSARMVGATSYEDWGFSFAQSYAFTSDPQVETNRQTKQEVASTNLGATWQLNSKLMLELSGTQLLQYIWAAPDSFEWSTIDWLHYQVEPGVDTAIGLGYGYVDVTEGPNMTFEQYFARVGWHVTNKINLNLQGGLESRAFQAAGMASMNNVIYNASIQYRPGASTVLSLNASRDVTASYFAGQVTRNAGVGATLQQRFLGRVYLTAGIQHGTSSYIASAPGVVAGRDDTYDSVNLRLSTAFLSRGTVGVTYQRSHNSSNTTGFGLKSNQYGVDLAWRF